MKFPGDAWEGAVLENGFLEEEAQNFLFGARSVLTFEDDHIKFWCGIVLPNVCGPLRPLLDMESIWMKLIVI